MMATMVLMMVTVMGTKMVTMVAMMVTFLVRNAALPCCVNTFGPTQPSSTPSATAVSDMFKRGQV